MKDLLESRKEIDEIDDSIIRLFEKRMEVCKNVAEYKLRTGKPVLDRQRELDKIATLKTKASDDFYAHGVEELFEQIMAMSRKMQYKLLNEDQKEKEEKLEIFIPNGPRLGNKVIEAIGVQKAYGDKLLFDNLNFMLPPNGIVGVIGPNGAGKTTLFRLIMGLEQVDKGTFEVGDTVKIAYVGI